MSTKRHHYVPQGFLKGFSDLNHSSGKMIWKYDKRFNNSPRRVSIKSVAWRPLYYAFEKEDGRKDTDTLEIAFAKTIDNDVPNIIQGIKAKPNEKIKLSEIEVSILASFLGFSLTRVPNFREGINDFQTQILQRLVGIAKRNNPFTAENDNIHASVKKSSSLKPMIKAAQRISESCLAKEWQFLIPHPEVKLVTSDNPVHFSLPYSAGKTSAGPTHPAVEIIINLRPNLALVCTPPRNSSNLNTYQLDKVQSRELNVGTVRAAKNQVFANQNLEGLSKLVKKYAMESQCLIV